MDSAEIQFRTATFGGFSRQDVQDYIDRANREHTQQMEQLTQELAQAVSERDKYRERAESVESRNVELSSKVQTLTTQLEEARQERQARESELANLRARVGELEARLEKVEHAASAYERIKDRTAGIELEAHCRAQEVRQEAEEKIRRAHTEVEQWLHKVNAGYDLLRSDMGGAITRTGQELDRLRQLLEQLSAHFDTQDEHLRKLSQDCVSDFTPPTPLPLEEQ